MNPNINGRTVIYHKKGEPSYDNYFVEGKTNIFKNTSGGV